MRLLFLLCFCMACAETHDKQQQETADPAHYFHQKYLKEIEAIPVNQKLADDASGMVKLGGGAFMMGATGAAAKLDEFPKHPEKVKSLKLDKVKVIESKLVGIKGQYLIFEDGVMNVRSQSGYRVTMEG